MGMLGNPVNAIDPMGLDAIGPVFGQGGMENPCSCTGSSVILTKTQLNGIRHLGFGAMTVGGGIWQIRKGDLRGGAGLVFAGTSLITQGHIELIVGSLFKGDLSNLPPDNAVDLSLMLLPKPVLPPPLQPNPLMPIPQPFIPEKPNC